MKNYAKVENGIVVERIYIDEKEYEKLTDKEKWLETSYNVWGGVYYKENSNEPHENQDLIKETSGRQRKNHANIGDRYDKELNAFIPFKPFPNWILNKETCLYEPPEKEKVKDWIIKEYVYDEETNTGYFEDTKTFFTKIMKK
jgi:hypothetical protein